MLTRGELQIAKLKDNIKGKENLNVDIRGSKLQGKKLGKISSAKLLSK